MADLTTHCAPYNLYLSTVLEITFINLTYYIITCINEKKINSEIYLNSFNNKLDLLLVSSLSAADRLSSTTNNC